MNHRQSILEWLVNIGKYVLLAVIILFFIRKSKDFYQMGYDVFAQKSVDEEGKGRIVVVEIPQGMGVKSVGEMLEEKGVILDAEIFPIQERLSSNHGKIRPGIYDLSTEMTPDQILDVISGGDEENS